MSWLLQVLLYVELWASESGRSLRTGIVECSLKFFDSSDNSHPSSSNSVDRFYEDGESDLTSFRLCSVEGLDFCGGTWDYWHSCLLSELLGLKLVRHYANDSAAGTDEYEILLLSGPRHGRVFCRHAV